MQTQFEVLVQSNLPQLLKTQFFVAIHHNISEYIWWKHLLNLESNFELQ